MNSFSQTPVKTETVQLNGSSIYYEVYGEGEPLFFLHGFTRSSRTWLSFVADYADDFEIYLVDLKGHGKSSSFTEKISLKTVAAEIDALTGYLNLKNIHAIGYSYGGETLFQLALLRPELIKKMVIIGSCGSWHANDFPNLVEYLRYQNIDNLPWMTEDHTSEEQIRSILEQIKYYNVSLTERELKSIQAKTLFVIGDHDEYTSFECVLKAKEHLPNSYLWVIPNTGHSAHTDKNKNLFVKTSKQFFGPNWQE